MDTTFVTNSILFLSNMWTVGMMWILNNLILVLVIVLVLYLLLRVISYIVRSRRETDVVNRF